MKLERFLAERSGDWSELEALLGRAGVSGANLNPNELQRLGSLYRSAAADLALARRSFPGTTGTVRLQALVASAYGVVYSRVQRGETPREFLSHGLWHRVRQNIGCVGMAAAVMVIGTALGAVWALVDPAAAVGILPSGFHAAGRSFHGGFYGIAVTARGGLAAEIFVNNIEVAFLAVAGGFTFGVLTVYSLAYNGALLGVLGAFEWRGGGFDEFVRLVVPHGMLELSCFALAGGAGLAIARAMIDPAGRTRSDALAGFVPLIGACVLGTVIFLVVAGLTEGFITPWNLATVPALLVGAVLAGSFWAMVIFRGRPESAVTPAVRGAPAV
jgi:uncharacterized membrane protein SpoIIM required for sporulation